jgi:hypothetical protein
MKRQTLRAIDLSLILTLLTALQGTTCVTGCAFMSAPQNAAKLSNPRLRIEKRGSNVLLEAGTEMNGKVKADYNPQTGELHIDAEVNSSPSPVIDAETKRAEAMQQFYAMQMAALTAQTQMTTGMVNNLVGALGQIVGSIVTGVPVPRPTPVPQPNTVTPNATNSN